jgi:ABC-2 type transport system permease protein
VKTSRPFLERPLVQLTLVRFREFIREPEALFWVFVFPVLLAAGLGIAFRNRPAETLHIGAENAQLAHALAGKSLAVRVMSRAEGEQALRTGRIALMALAGPQAAIVYRYDDTNPDGRAARLLAERALLRSEGRTPSQPESDSLVREPGSRYIDFLIPGLLGMNLMGSGMWGIGFAIVDARRKNLLKRLVVSPMSRAQYLLSCVF